ncbi:hypothetical protein CW736_02525 [Nonlabens sp. MB-3u-79]|jgi:transglutaminase-like putative cysteine protease|uniref:DUF3857 domain-containing protein n=1 Tax=Nonlabens sp. MB-3u-79 TaxID=2058134 RepID=UPI000C31073D|nr:DUF3857 domain-containing protein [Nonlabens sp. MB-3u-79]AUC78341.1 hypothetical protein CW736_02525 [Nonlabens sp. MB-3u-79]
MKNITILAVCLLVFQLALSQEELFTSFTIPDPLKVNANAVIRKNDVTIIINDYDDVDIETDRIVTVFNESGMRDIQAIESYDANRRIKKMNAVIYNSFGAETKEIRKNDFNDQSAVSSGTLYSDNRVKYLNYLPIDYPFTIHYTSTLQLKSTAFIPSWSPVEYFHTSTESSTYKVINNSDVEVKFKESHLEDFSIEKLGFLNYKATDIPAIKSEVYSPDFHTYGPLVKVALQRFSMEGVEGSNEEWTDFGKWMNDNLLHDVGDLSDDVREEIKTLTSGATTDIEKAKIVYQYMQDRSRYISVQVGIGGWKPISATEVHTLAYGDCKGLSNYAKALMHEVGVKANYAVIYGGSNIRNIDKSFSSTQGNHVVLVLPKLNGEKDVWLECTSKTNPFGFIAGFTDDRDALVITDDGGEIVHTTVYPTEGNLQYAEAQIELKADGSLTGAIKQQVSGYQYSFKDQLDGYSNKELKSYYQQYWDHLNGVSVISHLLNNDKDKVLYTEELEVEVDKYSSKAGDLLLFQPVVFNRTTAIPKKMVDRKLDFEIDRGYIDKDHYFIKTPLEYKIDVMPESVEIDTKFGHYSLKIIAKEDGVIEVKRELMMKNGKFTSGDYSSYRSFRKKIAKADQSKGIIKLK